MDLEDTIISYKKEAREKILAEIKKDFEKNGFANIKIKDEHNFKINRDNRDYMDFSNVVLYFDYKGANGFVQFSESGNSMYYTDNNTVRSINRSVAILARKLG